jgi:hypothetical protein
MPARQAVAVIAPCRASARALQERVRHLAVPGARRLLDGSYAVIIPNVTAATLDAVVCTIDEWLVYTAIPRTRLFYGTSEFRLTAPREPAAV